MNDASNNRERDIRTLTDTVRDAAAAMDLPAGVNPANVVELFRIAQRYETAMGAVEAVQWMKPK